MTTRQYGYSARGTRPVVRDYSYARWAPHYSAISAISSDGLLANQLMKNPEERFDANSFIQFLTGNESVQRKKPAICYRNG